jgi:Na+/H+ antiporter NhaD/arsenite permease-like protein
MVAILLVVYFVWDTRAYVHESLAALRRDRAEVTPLRLRGGLNALWLALTVLAVALLHAPWRELAIMALAAVAFWSTSPAIRHANGVTAAPMIEVAALFFGIFLTMIPALELLHVRGAELGVREPWHFFWTAGMLSAFLDNAPTYLTFLALAQGLDLPDQVAGVTHAVLAAISVGAVAMGANSYIGNAPNFMVKAIAEQAKVPMPTFFGYMLYSGGILVPLFVAVTLVFFR